PAQNRKSKKQSLVMIHGYRGNHHGLEAIAGAIENIDVYIPDLPGFGKSEPLLGIHSIEAYAKWLHEFLLALNFKTKPHLLGHSFGSIVCSAYAAKYRNIATLILENPVASPALEGPKAALTVIAKAFFWFASKLPETLGEGILKSWPMVRGMSIVMTKSRKPQLRRWIHAQHDANFNDFANRRVALEGYAASISNCVSDFAAKFRVPTMLMIGEKDDITSVEQQMQLFEALPGETTRLVQFADVGHLTHYEIPNQIAAAIEEWVSDSNG
ncbi:MAG: hypothetical protein RL149_774, partial [Actinomycetota bacterium]